MLPSQAPKRLHHRGLCALPFVPTSTLSNIPTFIPSHSFSHTTAISQNYGHNHKSSSATATNLFQLITGSSRPVRYTLYAGLGLMATAETTFWTRVIWAKFFASEDEKERADELLQKVGGFVNGYRRRWIVNYQNYWANNLWGV